MNKLLVVVTLVLAVAGCSQPESQTSHHSDEAKRARGIDVSHYQGQVDWPKVAAAGNSFAFIKATEGQTYNDPMFVGHVRAAVAAGLTIGVYHVFSPCDDGRVQARHFLQALSGVLTPPSQTLAPVLDIEGIQPQHLSCAAKEVKAWIDAVSEALTCQPIIYTSPTSWDRESLGDYANNALWLADYNEKPSLPEGWPAWTFWQHTQSGRLDGVEGSVDLSLYNGAAEDLHLQLCASKPGQ